MTFRTLIRRSLRFHWRSHLGVVLGATIGSAALIGALVVGDSVKGSLRERAVERLGPFALALGPTDRFFMSGLAPSGAVLSLPGTAANRDGSARANQINVLGVAADFWNEEISEAISQIAPGMVVLNYQLARKLDAHPGDEILIYIEKPSVVSQESPMTRASTPNASVRMTVQAVIPAELGGDFSLRASTIPVLNCFIRRDILGETVGLPARANLMLSKERWLNQGSLEDRVLRKLPSGYRSLASDFLGMVLRPETLGRVRLEPLPTAEIEASLKEMLKARVVLADIQATLRVEPEQRWIELVSERVFLEPSLVNAATNRVLPKATSWWLRDPTAVRSAESHTNHIVPQYAYGYGRPSDSSNPPATMVVVTNLQPQPILTYLATLLRAGTNAAPYSMVTAAGAPWTPSDLRDDEIVVSQWLADDLRVKPGDEIALSYFLPESGANLLEATNTFRVHSIVPMELPWADRTLMPDFPGIEKAESTSEWDAGFPLTYEIRKKDDDYWKQHRGTPKAFITLAAGQKMWGNRFGNLTAIRFPIPTNSPVTDYQAALEKKILATLKPEELGLRFEPVREQALKAAEESQDFGGLFLGFSFFVIAAALLLMAMLFQFGLDQRAPEIGTLLALGFTPAQVRKLFLREGVVLAFIGGVIGAVGGIYYAKAMIHGLSTVWRDAVGATALSFHVTGQTLVIGLFASVVVSTITIWLALRKCVKRSPRELLAGEIQPEESKAQSPKSKVIAVVALVGALGLVGWTLAKGDTANAGAFFGAGALVLIAGLAFANARLGHLSIGDSITLASLAVRGCARRRKRSLATMAMLACGSFLIVSIGVFRQDANRDATHKTSGTGGFALIGETTMPVVHDLNSQSGKEFFALDEKDLVCVNVVPFRVRAGDEASCLNLNAAQKPRLLGVKSKMLEGRFAFAKAAKKIKDPKSWKSLAHLYWFKDKDIPLLVDEIPAIGDANSIQWAMKKKVGDTIDYVDERGQPFKVRIVGAVANSILQGQLIIDEAEFVKRFPGESGYRMFLIVAPSNAVSQVSATLSRAMQDVGLELTPTVTRLNQFNAVQNTYLGTFQVLGGLGLLLGSVGLGIVVLRNVLERRGELAVMMAVGFRKATLQRLILMENGTLLLAGLALGVVAAAVAVLPALLSANGELPLMSLAITLGAVLVNGALWTWAATRFAVRGDLLKALRNE